MLKVCAAQVVHARGWPVEVGAAAVLYIGWKAYGAPLHVRFTGSKRMWRKPLVTLATIEPLWPVLRSVTAADSPAAVSWMLTLITSPWFIRSTAGVGVNDLLFCVSGPGGPIGFPFLVRYAKLTGSGQLGLATAPWMLPGPCNAPNCAWRLSIVSAAHQCFRSQEPNDSRPGG